MRLFSGHWSRTRRLSFAWQLLAVLLLASAVVLIAVSQVLRRKSFEEKGVLSLVVSSMDLGAATGLGIALLAVLVLGVLGFVQGYRPGTLQRREARGLIAFAWALVGTSASSRSRSGAEQADEGKEVVTTLVVASVIWFFTLTEVEDFRRIWEKQDGSMQAFLQDKLACCGYFNASSSGLFSQPLGLCAPFAQPGANVTSVQGCTTPIVAFADVFLNNVFTTIYGFTAIQLALFLTTLCLIISRRDDERFRLIWEKSAAAGGSAFE
ncbi:hypothetical protein JCM10207_006065 [Rhodosporidiobolus poonsookiae]